MPAQHLGSAGKDLRLRGRPQSHSCPQRLGSATTHWEPTPGGKTHVLTSLANRMLPRAANLTASEPRRRCALAAVDIHFLTTDWSGAAEGRPILLSGADRMGRLAKLAMIQCRVQPAARQQL